MGFNDILENIGGINRFQVLHTAMLLLPMCFMACHNFLQNFSAAVPAHHCKVALMDNGTKNYGHVDFSSFIPVDENQKPKSCLRYREAHFDIWTNNSFPNSTEPCDDGWVYDKRVFSSTIITEWNLVCRFRKMKQVAQSIYMAGVLIGAVLLGGLADRVHLGPRTLKRFNLLTWFMCEDCVLFHFAKSANFYNYSTRCLGRDGYIEISLVFKDLGQSAGAFCAEWSTLAPKWSRMLACGPLRAPSFGYVQFLLPKFGTQGVESWEWIVGGRVLDLFIGFLRIHHLHIWIIDAEALWLTADTFNSRMSNAQRLYKCRAVRIERRSSTRALSRVFDGKQASKEISVKDMKELRLKTLRIVLAVLGKGLVGGSFNCAYLYSGELFPTILRQTGMGFVAMKARVGSMVAPLVLMLWEISPILPSAIYGVAAITSGVAALFLCETRNQQLPDTVEDVESRFRAKDSCQTNPEEEVALKKCQPQASKGLLADTV
ncbi:Hypothetical predicted protein [Pelobates cultripes]|uniref:Uncharacterized protein n=1 Tax=Pelobates cultripes TaxID=61616 RepID=A0AAD1WRA5_PELCU|nr:Hypothetical predicted protein [Pelobates cultripes]